jgi:hypothetical protein
MMQRGVSITRPKNVKARCTERNEIAMADIKAVAHDIAKAVAPWNGEEWRQKIAPDIESRLLSLVAEVKKRR